MASVNKVILIGNAGKDSELRYTPAGAPVCQIQIATSRSWKNKETGERQEETEWHRVVFFDRLAEIAGEYIKKGKPIYVEGRLKTRKWSDKDGVERYTTEILVSELQLLGGRDSDDTRQQRAPAGAPPAAPQRQAAPAQRPTPRAAPTSSTGFDDMDDDIPFVSASFDLDMQPSIARRMRKYHF